MTYDHAPNDARSRNKNLKSLLLLSFRYAVAPPDSALQRSGNGRMAAYGLRSTCREQN